MFEFGRDLKKLFVQARESEDLSWLELIGVDLVEVEARQQSTDAGRVSCARPHAAWLRAAALWREHAERTGAAESLKRALDACADAARAARKPDEIARAAIAKAQTLLLRYDLCGDPANLERASEALPDPHPHDGKRALTGAIIGVTARIRARQARLAASQAETLRSVSKTTGASAILTEAIALLDAALKVADSHAVEDLYDLRMDRASLALEAGVLDRNLQLLDQAGRELQQLVESASPDYRPLTRARALCLCGAGMSALGALANNDEALAQGQALFDAAADQFTADHSPLDWVAVQIVKSDVQMKVGDEVMRLAEALTTPERVGQTLILGATARELVLEKRIASAQAHNDLAGLELIESLVRRSLSKRSTQTAHEPSFETAQAWPVPDWPVLDWVVDQMAMARIAHARLAMTGRPSCRSAGDMAMALMEAVEAARDHGCPAMAERAQGLIGGLVVSEKPSRA